jgi:SAM-dependent methyltransferase
MTREPLLEPLLARYRYHFSLRVIRKIIASGIEVKGFDIGCGYRGEFVRQANKIAGVEFYGGDIEVEKTNTSLMTFDFDARTAPPFTPNMVTMHAVMEHLNDPEAVVRFVYEILAPGGYFVFTAPSNAGKPVLEFLSFRLGLVSRQEIEDHKQYFNRASCLHLLSNPQGRFKEIQHRYFQLGLNNRVVARRG